MAGLGPGLYGDVPSPSKMAASAPIMPIDLTGDEDDDEPILVETRMALADSLRAVQHASAINGLVGLEGLPADLGLHAPAVHQWNTVPPPPETSTWVCLGLLRGSALCVYGLPPELQADEAGELPPVDPAWSHLAFWGDPEYRPVTLYEVAGAQPSGVAVLSAAPPVELAIATLFPPREEPGAQPGVLNEYGRVSDRLGRVLGPLLQHGTVQCVARAPIASQRRAQAFTQDFETLVMVRDADVDGVVGALTSANLLLDRPAAYDPADFPDTPRLLNPDVLQPPRARRLLLPEIPKPYVPPAVQSRERVEEEQHAKIHSVYAALQGADDLAETEAGPLITSQLFPHQKQALTFLRERERERELDELLDESPPAHVSLWVVGQRNAVRILRYRHMVTGTMKSAPEVCRGAILADDMGLGKTLTTIALIASTHDEAVAWGREPVARDKDALSDDEPQLVGDSRNARTAERARREELRCRSRATLLVCPLSIVSNWEQQVREHWAPHAPPRMYVYHGAGRTADPHVLADHDIVLTTYSTLGNEFSHQSTWTAAAGLADDDAREASAPRDVKRARVEAPNTCQRVEWFRVVLDEAHIVKEARTWQSKAVCNLSAPRRLCLTGTPIQNKIDDLYALLLFLRLDPFVDRAVWTRFCGDRRHVGLNNARARDGLVDPNSLARVQTIMKFLTLRRMKNDRRADGRVLLALPPKATRVVTLEFSASERIKYQRLHSQFREEFEEYIAEGTVGLHYATILHEILILRLMCDHASLVDASMEQQRAQLAVATGDAASAPRDSGLTRERAASLFSLLADSMMAACAACGAELSAAHAPVVTRCEHMFCAGCFAAHVGADAWPAPPAPVERVCPCCSGALLLPADAVALCAADCDERRERSPAAPPPETTGEFDPDDPKHWPASWSTKVRALMADLLPFSQCNPHSGLFDARAPVLDQVLEGATDEADAKAPGEADAPEAPRPVVVRAWTGRGPRPAPIKSVVFSQWTSMLAKISDALHVAGIAYRRLDGTMTRQQREEAMLQFQEEPGIEVFLVSLRAGGFGLNLVSACRAYLIDPYWNPAIENQGLDRIHRLGQQRPVIMTKYIMNQSIEEKLLELQQRKLEIANRVGSRRPSAGDAKKQRTDELKLLFS